MAQKPTIQQQRAIDAPHDRSAIVTAAAGSGKTTLLVGRIIRLLSDKSLNIGADTLAVMTFTRNAADSLRSKLIKALSEKKKALCADGSPEALETADYLSEQAIALRSASIGTIDSFCIGIIKENVQAFDLPVNFGIADAAKTASMQETALQLTMKYFYEKGEGEDASEEEISAEEREALFFTFSFEDDTDLQKNIVSISDALSSYSDSEAWLDESAAAYDSLKSLERRYIDVYRQNAVSLIAGAYHYLSKYTAIIADYIEFFKQQERTKTGKALDKLKTDREDIISNLKGIFAEDSDFFRRMVRYSSAFRKNPCMDTLEEFSSHSWEFAAKSAALTRKGGSNPIKARFSACRNAFKSIRIKLSEMQPFIIEEEALSLPTQRLAARTLVKLLKKYMSVYRDIKITSGCPDFSDCELMLLEKLKSDKSFRRQISDRFSCVIVDEFQDSNDVQAEIFRLISNGKNNLFYVGDVKQAIYTFRGGNPRIMAEMCRVPLRQGCLGRVKGGYGIVSREQARPARFKTDGADIKAFFGKHSRFTVIPLNKNFRSRKTVIDFVNMTFAGIMTERYGGVSYDDRAMLRFGAPCPEIPDEEKPSYAAEVHLLSYAKDENPDEEDDSGDVLQARFVAKRIKSLVDSGFKITDNGVTRPCGYSDFAVLLRNNKTKCYKDALAELDIPAITSRGRDFLGSEEISLVLNILRIVDNPLCDEELLKVMMSPVYGFTAEETAKVKLGALGLPDDIEQNDARAIAARLKGSSLYRCLLYCSRQLSPNKSENEDEEDDAAFPEADKAEARLLSAGIKRDISQKVLRLLSDLNAFRFAMSCGSVESLIEKVYSDTELVNILLTYEGGKQRLANIRLLRNYAADFEEREGGTLSDFLRFINTTKSSNRIEAASAPEDAENAVKIMTFHASKGLEMPIVIIAELNKPFLRTDCQGTVVMNHEYGFAMNFVDKNARYKTRPFSYNAISSVIFNGIFGEELRLLYVAMTRAREKLIIVGNCTKPLAELTMIDGVADTAFSSTVPLRWILASLLRYCPGGDMEELGKSKGTAFEISLSGANAVIERHITPEAPPIQAAAEREAIPADESLVETICANLRAEYPNLDETERREKYTVTELAHSGETTADAVVYLGKPYFMRNTSEFTGKEIGDAYHHLMEHFPLEELRRAHSSRERTQITERAVERLCSCGKITEREKSILTSKVQRGIEKVVRFFESGIGRRMLESSRVERELPFYAELPARALGLDFDGEVSLQGRTDMFFYEDKEIVLVDYKSDSKEGLSREKDAYARQLYTYKSILPRITGAKVKQMYIYAFSDGEEIDVEEYLRANSGLAQEETT